jgi:putative tryptophan/tyrosine transport system substrate-binding protein
MRRREFIGALGGLAMQWPLIAHAQRSSKVPRVGVLSPGNPPPGDPFRQAERFEAGLRDLGWQPGKTVLIEYRYAEGRLDRLPAMAAELVSLPVDAIIARGQTVAAARDATETIGIIMAADPDPVGNGFAKSLARPGGNITGFSTQAFELEAKQLDLLRQAVPTLERVAVLTSGRPGAINIDQHNRRQAAAKALLIDLLEIPISDTAEVGEAFSKIGQARVGAVLISGTLWFADAATIAGQAIEQRLASITNLREFAKAGALMTYGVSFAEIHRRSAIYFDKIIKGANPADLPIEQPTKFDLVVNLRTAKSLGIEIPSKLLSTADEVIE